MSFTFPLLIVLLTVFALAQGAEDCSSLSCANGFEDASSLFTAGFKYGAYGLAYVRDRNQPPIAAAHNASITRVIIAIHGNARDAENYFCYADYAARLQGQQESTYVIAPHFYVTGDSGIQADTFFWVNTEAWKVGGRSDMTTTRISSFEILDDMIIAFNNKDYFPGLKDIVIVGHSGGGQTVQRYAIASGIDSKYGNVRYVVENPGSYAYLDSTRPVLPELSLPTCTACNATEIVARQYTFGLLPRETQLECNKFNTWKMGLDNGNNYLNNRSYDVIRQEYKVKNVTYLLGTDDTCNSDLGRNCGCSDNGLDSGCEAELGGYCRLERGVAFHQYLQFYFGVPVHSRVFVSGLGHDGCLMITSQPSLQVIFSTLPAGTTTTTTTTTTGTSTDSTTSQTTTSQSTNSPSTTSGTPSPSATGTTTDGQSGSPRAMTSSFFSLLFVLYFLL